MKFTVTPLLFAAAALTGRAQETLDTRIGQLSFTHDVANGYPTLETQEKLFDQLDFQRACLTYPWAIPLIAFQQWSNEQEICDRSSAWISCSTRTGR